MKQVSTERRILREALSTGLTITPSELQAAADDFRTVNSLNTATDLAQWLAREHWTASQFEAAVEHALLLAKLDTHTPDGASVDSRQQDRESVDLDLQVLIETQ